MDTMLLDDTLATWNELKNIRSKQKFTATTVGLTIFTQDTNKDEDKAM